MFGPLEPAFIVGILVPPLVYEPVCLSLWGTTLGKKVFSLRVVGPGERKPTFGRALARSVSKFISAQLLYIGHLVAAVRGDKRALHDLIADTWVIQK
jgi:uncharacterized RDD family membrane protein YckC